MCEGTKQKTSTNWGNVRNEHDYTEDKITVTITFAETATWWAGGALRRAAA